MKISLRTNKTSLDMPGIFINIQQLMAELGIAHIEFKARSEFCWIGWRQHIDASIRLIDNCANLKNVASPHGMYSMSYLMKTHEAQDYLKVLAKRRTKDHVILTITQQGIYV